jgi:hypothetical protein
MRYTDAIKREGDLLDDGIVDTLGSVGATRGVHTSAYINASTSAQTPSLSSSRSF